MTRTNPLRALAAREGLTLPALADRMGVAPSALRNAARDGLPPLGAAPAAGRPRAVTVERIAAALRLEPAAVAADLAPLVARWEAGAAEREAKRAAASERFVRSVLTSGIRPARGESLRRVCEQLGIGSQRALAERLGCSPSTAGDYLNRGFRASCEPGGGRNARRIAGLLGVPEARLVDEPVYLLRAAFPGADVSGDSTHARVQGVDGLDATIARSCDGTWYAGLVGGHASPRDAVEAVVRIRWAAYAETMDKRLAAVARAMEVRP